MTDIDTAAIRADVLCSVNRAWPVIIVQLCEALDDARAETLAYAVDLGLEMKRAEAAEAELASFENDAAVLNLTLFRDLKAQAARAEAAEKRARFLADQLGDAREVQVAAEAKLADAIELAEEVIPYAGEYFREKWDLDGRLAALKGETE